MIKIDINLKTPQYIFHDEYPLCFQLFSLNPRPKKTFGLFRNTKARGDLAQGASKGVGGCHSISSYISHRIHGAGWCWYIC